MVRVVTAQGYSDKTVILAPGSHPFIKRDSSVEYGSAALYHVTSLQAAIHRGACVLDQDMPATLLGVIRDGLLNSPRTIHWVADYCRQVLRVE